MSQSEFEANKCPKAPRQAPENVDFGLAFHWLRKWGKSFKPSTERTKANPKQTCNYFQHWNETAAINNLLYEWLQFLHFVR